MNALDYRVFGTHCWNDDDIMDKPTHQIQPVLLSLQCFVDDTGLHLLIRLS